MTLSGTWIYREPEVRHAFSLCRVAEAGTPDERYDLLGTIEVKVDRLNPNRLSEGLHPWALATLTTGGFGFGRYYAALSTLDDEGEPYRALAHHDIDWSGTTVLVPAEPTNGPSRDHEEFGSP